MPPVDPRELAEVRRDPGRILALVNDARQLGATRWRARCPLHADRSPSMDIRKSRDGYRWFCSPCGKSGDVIALVQELEGLGFPAACARLGLATEATGKAPLSHAERFEAMPRPAVPWDASSPVYLFCDCDGGVRIGAGKFDRVRLECDRCGPPPRNPIMPGPGLAGALAAIRTELEAGDVEAGNARHRAAKAWIEADDLAHAHPNRRR